MTVLAVLALALGLNGATLSNVIVVPGSAHDETPGNVIATKANVNRLGGFGSDLFYDRSSGVFYGLTDRGPGGGVIGYETRVHKFTLDIDPVTGAAGNFHLLSTIRFTIPAGAVVNGIAGPAAFNGIDPMFAPKNAEARRLGTSHDPEGFVVGPNGHFYVSDEYGPSIYEFQSNGAFVRAFIQPPNVLPSDAKGKNVSSLNSIILVRGRQRNRGFEGLAISPDGTRLFAILQDPLAEEGSNTGCLTGCVPAGRFSRNVRLIVFSTKTGKSIAQYVYQLESLDDLNARVPANAFSANAQGVNIGLSALSAINDHEFLVLERDNRGFGVDDLTRNTAVALKRIYRIDITHATDVSRISLAEANDLPRGIVPVEKTLFLDIAVELQRKSAIIPEKMEGLAIGPRLADGTYELLVASDNDFSVTQNDSNVQFDVCTDGQTWQQVSIDDDCPKGLSLIPTFLLSFKSDLTLVIAKERHDGKYSPP